METILRISAYVINKMHDLIITTFKVFGYKLSDKDLHFWIIGLVGLIIFIMTDILFRRISRWSMSIITFIYTFTVLVVLVFGLEIEQKITGRGKMEFADIVAGLWGFIVIFAVYVVFRILVHYIKRIFK